MDIVDINQYMDIVISLSHFSSLDFSFIALDCPIIIISRLNLKVNNDQFNCKKSNYLQEGV